MANLNKCLFIGNLTKDPEIRYASSGDAIANFSIAINEGWKDKNGERKNKVEYINIVMYRRLADVAGEYLKKGRPVYIEGRMQTRKWQTKDGQDRYTTEIVADQMQMLGGRDEQQSYSETKQTREPEQKPIQKEISNESDFDDFDDDIPF